MNQSQRILVVDEEPQIVRVLRRSLAARGYEVQVAIEGEQALELLVYLIRHPNKALTHRTLLGAVWGGDYVEQTEYLRVFIGQLRKKIEADPAKPRYILTEPWIGYRFNAED